MQVISGIKKRKLLRITKKKKKKNLSHWFGCVLTLNYLYCQRYSSKMKENAVRSLCLTVGLSSMCDNVFR